MAGLSRESIYGMLRKVGFDHGTAVIMLAVAGGESGWNPAAHNPNAATGDNSYGLFQINMLGGMGPERRKAFGIKTNEELFDPWTNIQAAYKVYQWQGLGAWSVYKSGAYQTHMAKAKTAAQNYQKNPGAYGYEGSGGGYTMEESGGMDPGGSSEAINVPSDASWIQVGGKLYVAYRIKGGGGASSVVYWEVDRPDVKPPAGKKPVKVAADTFKSWQKSWVNAGSVEALAGMSGTFKDAIDKTLYEMGIYGSDALADKGVLEIIALYGARPDMSEAELANRLRQTDWYNSKTEKQREWNDLGDAEKEQRIMDSAADLVGLWFTYVGEDIDLAALDTNGDGITSIQELKKGNKDLALWAERLASGGMTQQQVVNQWMKEVARENPDSPWMRQVRSEEQAQGSHEVQVETAQKEILDLYREWGMAISDGEAARLAEEVVMNRVSMAELQMDLDEKATAMYPTKPKGVSTLSWARPYMSIYQNTLEVAEPELMDKTLQKALHAGMSLGEFQVELRHDERWKSTLGAQDEMAKTISKLGEKMGYV